MSARARIACAALFLLALLPRLHATRNGGPPHDFVPDEHAVRAALAMLEREDPLLLGGSPSTYPHLLPWMLAPVYAGLYAWDRASGVVSSPAEFGERAALEPWRFFLAARVLCALFGAATALVVARLARRLGASARGALAAGALVATSPLALLLSSQARPWAPLVFFFALAVERAVAAQRLQGRSTACCALAAAAAAATHPLGFAALLPWLATWPSALRHRPRALATGALLAGALIFAAYPSAWLAVPQPKLDEFAGAPLVLGGQGLFVRFDGSRAGELLLELAWMEPVLLAAIAAASLGALRLRRTPSSSRALRLARASTGALALLLAAFFCLYFGTLLRYFLPALALAAAWAMAMLWPAGGKPSPFRACGAFVLALAIMASAATCVRLALVLARDDTRVLAARAVEPERSFARFALEAGSAVLPLDVASLERLQRIDPEGFRRRERARLAARAPDGFAALPLERVYATRALETWNRGFERAWIDAGRSVPHDAGERLRAVLTAEDIGDVLTARRHTRDGSALLDRELARGARERARFDPGSDDARLPAEPSRGWLTIWRVARSGPLVVWYTRG